MSQVDSSSHTFKKSPKLLLPVPSLQVNYNTTSKTPLRHPSIQVRGDPRHMINRHVRITSDPEHYPNQSPKCSPFKQIRVQPLRHHQDSSIYKLEDMQDRYMGDMSRLNKICQDLLSGPLYPKLSMCLEGAQLTQLVQLVSANRLFLGHKGRVNL